MAPTLPGARISLRISPVLWQQPERLAEVLNLVRDYRDCLSEVTLFTGLTHCPLTLEDLRARAAQLQQILPCFKELGVSAGINHLCTIGHLDEALEYSLDEPWQKLVGEDATAAGGSYCPRDPAMRAYIRQCYLALAQAGPDFIWVDDDVRLRWHRPLEYACFCERCLQTFGEQTGQDWSLPQLRLALNGAEAGTENASGLRRQWLEHNRATMAGILALVRQSVDEITLGLPLGWMPIEMWFEGHDFKSWFSTLANGDLAGTKARPGGGFYDDNVPGDLLWKAHNIGWQTADLPPELTDIQSEHENFPYQPLRKSVHAFGTETGVYLAAGSTGCALNLMGTCPDPLDEYLPYLERTRQWKPFYDVVVQQCGRSRARGLWAAYTKDLFALQGREGDWFGQPHSPGTWGTLREFAEVGLPPAYHADGAVVTLVGGDTPLLFDEAQLGAMLSGGVVLDGTAAAHLHRLGLGHLVGFDVEEAPGLEAVEQLAHHPLNGGHTGWHRDCRPSFWKQPCYRLQPHSERAEAMSTLQDLWGHPQGVGSGTFRNELGGRVAVLGYTPWTFVQNRARNSQLKTLLCWLSKNTLPGYVSSFRRGALWCRTNSQGLDVFFLVNNSLDEARGLKLNILSGAKQWLHRCEGEPQALNPQRQDGVYNVIEIPCLRPWEMVLLTPTAP